MRIVALAGLLALAAACEEGEKLPDTGPVYDTGGASGTGTGGGAATGNATGGTATGGGTGGTATGGAGTGGTGTGTGGTGDCTPTAADDLGDLSAPTADPDGVCGAGPLWDAVPGYASWFVGDFTVDACGVVGGTETMHVVANDAWTSAGGADCTAIWQISGTVDPEASLSAGATTWTITLALDGASTCSADISGGSGAATYTVSLDAGGTVFAFEGGSEFGRGAWNANNATYRSPVGCTYL